MFGVHWTAVDDNGDKFGRLFDVGGSWNIRPFPTRVTADKYFKYGWSLEMAGSYTEYRAGKLINGSTDVSGIFAAFDVNGKYSFYQMYAPRARWIEPYFTFGLGYTLRTAGASTHMATFNGGFGLNFWIYRGLGVQFHSQGKLGLFPTFYNNSSNYLQHSAGVVLRVGQGKHTNGEFGRRKAKWAHGNKRFRKNKGGQ